MDAWGNFWQKGHSTTFGEYYADGYTRGYINSWWRNVIAEAASPLSVLEVGCGNASLLPVLFESHLEGHYVGVDAADVAVSDAVTKRDNGSFSVELVARQGIELATLPRDDFDIIASVYGLEYSNLDQSIPRLKSLTKEGRVELLVHHNDSIITKMSEKALSEFDFIVMAIVVQALVDIDICLNECHGDPALLPQNAKAVAAREVVNDEVSKIMNVDPESRNPILVDFVTQVLLYFKHIRDDTKSRKLRINSILPDFEASKERFRQMVEVAKDEKGAEAICQQFRDVGFAKVHKQSLEHEGAPVAWAITAVVS
ncbi:class I SAM-dependent methyltransferase [uncultured Umboniibacter sp.]|uniref:methyltransferase domain-containing protein n=1 Tax=uncultured Umboniibacter sp. TaxID=1798917 RepID=UPI0026122FB8|nr:class I SAM-dependent methyltransferase [uncultured Umboniibacter sp.]